jgi:hypothetical protein
MNMDTQYGLRHAVWVGYAVWTWTYSLDMAMRPRQLNVACSGLCPRCMPMSMPSMTMLHVPVTGCVSISVPHPHIHAACPFLCCMSESMPHVHVHCMSMSMLHVPLMLRVQIDYSSPNLCCKLMLLHVHVHALAQELHGQVHTALTWICSRNMVMHHGHGLSA